MSGYSRIRRQQLLQEAEGYLDLIYLDQVLLSSKKRGLRRNLRHRLAGRTISVLDQLAPEDKHDHRALFLRGQAYRLMGKYRQAIPPLCKASQADPDNFHIHLALAWCYKRVHRLDLAIETLEDALEVAGEQGIIHYNLACYWSLAKNVGLTLAYLARAFELDSHYRDLVAGEPDFNPVRNHPEFLALTSVIV